MQARVLALLFAIGVAAALFEGCGSKVPACGPGACDGCCSSAGECVVGTSGLECGLGGQMCKACLIAQICELGTCVTNGSGGGNSVGGGTGGGVGGGTGGGVGGGTGGGVGGGTGGGVGGGTGGGVGGGTGGGVGGGTGGGVGGGTGGGVGGGSGGGVGGGTGGGVGGGSGGGVGGGTGGGTGFCTDSAIRACYRFDEGTGSIVNDGSGNSNTGTITGATWTTGHSGFALSFSGSFTDQVAIADSMSLHISGPITVEAWINPVLVGTDGIWDRLIDRGVNSGFGMGLGTGNTTVGGICFKTTTSAAVFVCGNTAVSAGVWSHVAATWDSATMVVYLNGVADGSISQSGVLATPTMAMLLGNRAEGASTTSYPYDGLLDDVRIYARAKSAAEICADAGKTWNGSSCL